MMTGEALGRARQARNLTQAELGRRAGVDPAQISRWEAGLTPSPAASARIARALDSAPGERLLRERDPELVSRAVERSDPGPRRSGLAPRRRRYEAARTQD